MMMIKRLLGEFKRDWSEGINKENNAILDNYDQLFLELENRIIPKEINIFLINDVYDKIVNITIDFKNNDNRYPFKPPKIKVNTVYDYFDILGQIPHELVKQRFKINCLCCNSILCRWGPSYCLNDIVNECTTFFDLKFRSENIHAAEMCVMKKFGHYLPIAEFL